MKTDNGQRYQIGQWPTEDPHVYDPTHHPLAISDNPPGGGFAACDDSARLFVWRADPMDRIGVHDRVRVEQAAKTCAW